jgi:uncharacterized protein with PQ loop repeat
VPPALADWANGAFPVDLRGRTAEWSEEDAYIALPRPGGDAWLRVSLDGKAEYELTDRGAISWLNDLHKGRNTGAVWSWFIDIFALACLVFCITGFLIMKIHAANRPSTWPVIGFGIVLPAVLALCSFTNFDIYRRHCMKLSPSLALTLPMLRAGAVGRRPVGEVRTAATERGRVPQALCGDVDRKGRRRRGLHLAVLYDVKKKDNAGEKWVKDMRTWWRKAGRETQLPIDGVSGATRAAGEHTLSFGPARTGIDKLPAGDYKLVIEAAREAGGRELVRVPFTLPPRARSRPRPTARKNSAQSPSTSNKEAIMQNRSAVHRPWRTRPDPARHRRQASAHRPWMLPTSTIVENKEAWVTIDGAISEGLFDVDHMPLRWTAPPSPARTAAPHPAPAPVMGKSAQLDRPAAAEGRHLPHRPGQQQPSWAATRTRRRRSQALPRQRSRFREAGAGRRRGTAQDHHPPAHRNLRHRA